jgi:hypothetical protein
LNCTARAGRFERQSAGLRIWKPITITIRVTGWRFL